MRNEVIEKLRDPEVAAGVLDAGSEAEIVQVLGTAQVQVTPEEAQTILDGKRQLILGAVGSLTGDELANIAGGMDIEEVPILEKDETTTGSKIVETMSKPGKWIGSKLPGKAGEFVNEHPIATTTTGGAAVLALGAGVAAGAGYGIYKLIKKVKEKKAKKI